MGGVKVAAIIVGSSALAVVLIVALVLGMVTWLGWWGGVIAFAIAMLALFAVIAIAENHS
jgi:type II secretory pathway component PulF